MKLVVQRIYRALISVQRTVMAGMGSLLNIGWSFPIADRPLKIGYDECLQGQR